MFHNLNPCMDFDQIFRIRWPQDDLELIIYIYFFLWGGGGGVSSNHFCHGNALNNFGFQRLLVVHKLN